MVGRGNRHWKKRKTKFSTREEGEEREDYTQGLNLHKVIRKARGAHDVNSAKGEKIHYLGKLSQIYGKGVDLRNRERERRKDRKHKN